MATNKTLKAHVVLVDKFTKPLRNVNRKLQGFSRSMSNLQRSLTPVIATAGLAQGAFVALTKSAIDYTDKVSDLAARSNVSIEQYQKMSRYANMAGISNEQLADSYNYLNRNIGSAIQGDKKYTAMLLKMGYTQKQITDGNIDTNDAMHKFADLIASIQSPQEKAKVAMDMLGRSGSKLVPMFNNGSSAIVEFGKSIKNNVITKDDEKRIKNFTARMSEMSNSVLASFAKSMSKQMPKITKIVDKFTKFFQSDKFANALADVFDKLANTFEKIDFSGLINGFLKIVSISAFLLQHIDKIAIFFASVFAVKAVASVISVASSFGSLISAVKLLSVVAMTSPFGWIAIAIAGIVTLIANWDNLVKSIQDSGGVFSWLGDILGWLWEKVSDLFTMFKSTFDFIGDIIKWFTDDDEKEIKVTKDTSTKLNTEDLVTKQESLSTVDVNLKAPSGYTAIVEKTTTNNNSTTVNANVGMSYYGGIR